MALDVAIKNINDPRDPSPSPSPTPSPPPSRAQTQEREHSEAQSSVGGELFFMEVSPQEQTIILQTRELVNQSVKTLVKQRDNAHFRCNKMWKDVMMAYYEDLGMDAPIIDVI